MYQELERFRKNDQFHRSATSMLALVDKLILTSMNFKWNAQISAEDHCCYECR